MTEQFVVDASVVAKLYLKDEQHTNNVDMLFLRFEQGQVELLAPRIVIYEVPAAVKSGAARVRADNAMVRNALISFEGIGLIVIDDSGAIREAMDLALSYSCSYYDALYLLLAEDLSCHFITADEKLYRNMKKRVSYIVFIGSYK